MIDKFNHSSNLTNYKELFNMKKWVLSKKELNILMKIALSYFTIFKF